MNQSAVGDAAEDVAGLVGTRRRQVAGHHALRLEALVELAVDDPAVERDEDAGPVGYLFVDGVHRDRDLVLGGVAFGDQWVPLGRVELIDTRVAPDLLLRGGRVEGRQRFGGAGAPLGEPVGASECSGPVGGEGVLGHTCRGTSRRQPTAPSISSSIRRVSSTAYSIGSVLVIGSMNPLTMSEAASVSERPRLIR